MRRNAAAAFEGLLRWQTTRPGVVLAAVALVTAGALALAVRLKLVTSFDALLPGSRPSVVELHRVSSRISSLSTIFVVIEGEDPEGLRKASDALVPALRALGPPWVGQVENGVQDARRFLEPRAGLYASLPNLIKLRNRVEARFAYEVDKQTGLGLDTGEPPPKLDAQTVKDLLGINTADEKRYPDGYYQSQDGKKIVLSIRTGILGTDFGLAEQAIDRVREVVQRVDPRRFDPTARFGLSGDLAIGLAEYKVMTRDLTEVGLAGAGMILAVVLLYYLRIRALLAMGLAIGIGLSWTFGFTELVYGHLNIATGFLFTIIGGNGINFSIIYMARYLEERRRGSGAVLAVSEAARKTWHATLVAAAAASAAYGALVVTEFKGFQEFGVIGGVGMSICWLATFLSLPSILIVMERVLPLEGRARGWVGRITKLTAEGVPFGRPFAFLIPKAPGVIAGVGTALALAGAVLTVFYIRSDPMEYDTNRIQSDRRAVAEVHRLIGIAIRITGSVGLDGMAIMTDRLDQVAPLKAALEAKRDAAPADAKPFKAVHTLQDFVPTDQAAKIPILLQIKHRYLEAKRRGFITDAQEIEPYLPPDDLKPFGIADLPDAIARPFTERDGTRGRIVYISPLDGDITADAHYLLRWADSYRRTVLPDGSVILGSGRAVIYADMWQAVISDAPVAMLVSFVATLLIVALAFRGRRQALQVILTLLVGVFWAVGALALMHVKLNFLNFVALPVTFGIGVDYAVNIALREQDLGDPIEVLRRTGGAVILCSLTTLLGYLALVQSVNFAVRSLGVAAVAGEVSCLLAAVLVLPAALVFLRSKRSPPAPSAQAGLTKKVA